MSYPNHLEYIVPATQATPKRLMLAVQRQKFYARTTFEIDHDESPSFPSDAWNPDGSGKNKNDTNNIGDGLTWSLSPEFPPVLPEKEPISYTPPDPTKWGNQEDMGNFNVHAPGDIWQFDSLSLGDLTLIEYGEVYVYEMSQWWALVPLQELYTWIYWWSEFEQIWHREQYDNMYHGSPGPPPTGYFAIPEYQAYLKDEWVARWWTWAYFYYRYTAITPRAGGIIPLLLPFLALFFGVAPGVAPSGGRMEQKKRIY